MSLEESDRFSEGRAPHRTRIEALFAANGRSAVILRRGPKLHHQLLRWNLANDTFTRGQWLKGTARLCDLDPAGDKLLYWARQWHSSAPRHPEDERDDASDRRPLGAPLGRRGGRAAYGGRVRIGELKGSGLRPRRNEGVWTALSTPPFFSALAIWPSFGHWTGGGWFDGPGTIVLQEDERGLVPKLNARIPDWLTLATPPRLVPGRHPGSADRPTYADGRASRFDDLATVFRRQGVRWVEWFHIHGRDLLFAADGQLFRLANHSRVAVERVLDEAAMVLDLRPMRFELIPAPPEAMVWRGAPPRDNRLRSRR